MNYRYKLTPYETYKKSLILSHLDTKNLGKVWIDAGEKSLRDSLIIQLPFEGIAYFSAEHPAAIGYRFTPDPGEEISVIIQVTSDSDARVFADVFEEIPDSDQKIYKRLYSSDSTLNFTFEVIHSLPHIIRVQPELLVSGHFSIKIQNQPSLAFPVSGKDGRAIWSVWGDPRDGGKRKHRGIDIFARRGTPALAAADATVRRVGHNRLGGKVVWLWDAKHNQNLYYAHLDSQLVKTGQKVLKGDTIGLIGNTGNAITTPPHLHFGVYKRGSGAVNPYHFVVAKRNKSLKPLTIEQEFLGKWVQTDQDASLRESNNRKSAIIGKMNSETPVLIQGLNGEWARTQLPDKTVGFIHYRDLILDVTNPVTNYDSTSILLNQPAPSSAPVGVVSKGSRVEVIGSYQDFILVQTESRFGWIMIKP